MECGDKRKVSTDVAWCSLSVSNRLLSLVKEIRNNEEKIASSADSTSGAMAAREIITHDVDEAAELSKNTGLSNSELFLLCEKMTGRPWGRASARRDMRELIRIHKKLESQHDALPRSPHDFLGLWSAATQGEVPVYKESATAQFRRYGIPFGHGSRLFDHKPPAAGYETVEAARIPEELDALTRWTHRADIPIEALAGSTHFLVGHIHPFADGNGHLARMLSCMMLARNYSAPTLLAFIRRMHAERAAMSRVISRAVISRNDIETPTFFFLTILKDAQCDILPQKTGRVGLPLRAMDADGFDLASDCEPNAPVYLLDDRHALELIADAGDLSNACTVYNTMAGAWESGSAATRPLELVRLRIHDKVDGYAVVLERAERRA